MNQNEIEALFAILRSAIDGSELNDREMRAVTPTMLPALFRLSARHDVAHLLALGLRRNGLGGEVERGGEAYVLNAVCRYERQQYEYEKLCAAFERAQVPFLPLKGSVLRAYYPEPWMRTSCDIDVLVHERDAEKAADVLAVDCGCAYHEKGSHDISLFTPAGVHVELHYDLVEDGIANGAAAVLRRVWDTSGIRSGSAFCREMSDEMFYFYHVAHMAKHFEIGGCGIRPFIDLWILDRMDLAGDGKRDRLLEQGRLLKFANAARRLSRIWFSGEAHDAVTRQMEAYILRGGVYGNAENRILVQQQKKGGRAGYALSKVFVPYDVIRFHYPILQKHRWLTPVMEVRRWFKLLFCGHAKRSLRELRFNRAISAEEADAAKDFLEKIGL